MECLKLLAVLFSVFYLSHTTPVVSEPSCYSDFDYKDKLLTKVIEMEVHMKSELKKYEELTKELQDKLQVFTAKMNNNEQIVGQLSTAVQEKLTKVDKTLADSSEMIDNVLSNSREIINNAMVNSSDVISGALTHSRSEIERYAVHFERQVNASFDVLRSEVREQVNQMDQQMKLSLSNITETVNKTAVAFTAYGLKNGDDVPLGQKLIYTETVTNVGDSYGATTGLFTAPIKGVYYFVVQYGTGNHAVSLSIRSEGRTIQNGRSSSQAPWSTTSFSGVAVLQTGERVWVECYAECGRNRLWLHSNSRASFSGMLIQAMS